MGSDGAGIVDAVGDWSPTTDHGGDLPWVWSQDIPRERPDMFLLIVTYTAPIADVERVLPDHLAFVDSHYADGTFLVSGRQVPRTGGFILAAGDDRAAVERMIATDPFITAGVAHYTVLEVQPTRAAPSWQPALLAAGVRIPQ
jgi:uncharacterized protein YciI